MSAANRWQLSFHRQTNEQFWQVPFFLTITISYRWKIENNFWKEFPNEHNFSKAHLVSADEQTISASAIFSNNNKIFVLVGESKTECSTRIFSVYVMKFLDERLSRLSRQTDNLSKCHFFPTIIRFSYGWRIEGNFQEFSKERLRSRISGAFLFIHRAIVLLDRSIKISLKRNRCIIGRKRVLLNIYNTPA